MQDSIECNAPLMKRILRQQCSDGDWTLVEDTEIQKLCESCAKTAEPGPVVFISEPSMDTLQRYWFACAQRMGNYNEFSQFNAFTAPVVNWLLTNWLTAHPERAADARRQSLMDEGRLVAGMAGLTVDVEQAMKNWEEDDARLLFGTELTHSPDQIGGDGFEEVKVADGADLKSSERPEGK
jgi:hypothetical protein